MENARPPDACPGSTHGFLRPLPAETALIVFPGSARSLFDSNGFLFDSNKNLFASKNFLFASNNPSVAKPWPLAYWKACFVEIMLKCKKSALAVGQVHSFYYLCKRVPVDKAAMTQMAP